MIAASEGSPFSEHLHVEDSIQAPTMSPRGDNAHATDVTLVAGARCFGVALVGRDCESRSVFQYQTSMADVKAYSGHNIPKANR